MTQPYVIKIGGSLLRDAPAWSRVLESALAFDAPTVFVISAGYGVTDRLLKMIATAARGNITRAANELNRLHDEHEHLAHELLGDTRAYRTFLKRLLKLEQQMLEYLHLIARAPHVTGILRHPILAKGEQLAATLAVCYLNTRQRPATVVDPRCVLMASRQPGPRLQFHINDTAIRSRILEPLEHGTIPIIPGFYARTSRGRMITLGRGGSDLTAALIAAALKAAELQFWTDVPELRSGDPGLITDTRPVPAIPYELALIIARIGAKRFHPDALEPVARQKIPARITSPVSPKTAGTLIAPDIQAPPGPLLIAHVSPVIHFRFTWTTLPPQSIRDFLNELHLRVQPDFTAFAEHPPCVHGYLMMPSTANRRVLIHLARHSHADLQLNKGAIAGIVGHNLSPALIEPVLKRHPCALLLPWMTDTFIPVWAPQTNVKRLIQDLHRCLFESPPSGSPHGAAPKPQRRRQNAQKHRPELFTSIPLSWTAGAVWSAGILPYGAQASCLHPWTTDILALCGAQAPLPAFMERRHLACILESVYTSVCTPLWSPMESRTPCRFKQSTLLMDRFSPILIHFSSSCAQFRMVKCFHRPTTF